MSVLEKGQFFFLVPSGNAQSLMSDSHQSRQPTLGWGKNMLRFLKFHHGIWRG